MSISMAAQIKRYIFITAGVLLLSVIPIRVAADVVHLKSGETLEGEVQDCQDHVSVTLPHGSMDILKSQIARVEKKALPQDIFAGRLKQRIDKKDAQGCVELAQWAWQQGLEPQYVTALRTALLLDKNHKAARNMLRDYQLRIAELPYNEKAVEKIRGDFGQEFSVLRTRHYRIGYNCSDFFAERTAQRLEHVYRQFLEVFRARHFEPVPISDRQEVILFDTHEQFLGYARKHDKTIWNAAGFYSDRTRRSYFYDACNDKQYRQQIEKLSQAEDRLETFRKEVLSGDKDQCYIATHSDGSQDKLIRCQMLGRLREDEAELKAQLDTLRDSYQEMNANVTIHEATHQLAYNCGIHNRYYRNPVWLVEGLAVYFEATSQSYRDKPGEVHPQRLERFLQSIQTSDAIPLGALITQDGLFNTQDPRAEVAYASAWALFYYLVWQKQETLFDYMYDLSLRMSGEPYEPAERKKDFESYFGDMDQLEAHWYSYMRNL